MAQQQQNGQIGKIGGTMKAAFKDAQEEIKTRGQNLKSDVMSKVQSGDLNGAADDVTNTLKQSFDEISSQIEEQFGEVRETAQKYIHELTEYAKENPVRVLVGAVGVGIVVGRLFTGKSFLSKKLMSAGPVMSALAMMASEFSPLGKQASKLTKLVDTKATRAVRSVSKSAGRASSKAKSARRH